MVLNKAYIPQRGGPLAFLTESWPVSITAFHDAFAITLYQNPSREFGTYVWFKKYHIFNPSFGVPLP